jgi:retron-type reverse transcriptase
MPRRYYNLYPQIHTFSNLWLAFDKASKGKRRRPTVAKFEYHLERELIDLQSELREERYKPGGYRSFTVHDPKRRRISAAPFRDRVVHHALMNIIGPLFERQFIYDTYANRVGKGTHAALDRCTYFMRRYRYVLPCDIKQFFPSIDHAILRDILDKTVGDGRTLKLCERIITSGTGILDEEYEMTYFPNDDLLAASRPRGLPIGNLTSQFWANVYLGELDQFIKRELRVTAYIRYVDDFLFFADDKKNLAEWREAIVQFLICLRLTIHTNTSQPRPVKDGIPFLGFIVFSDHRRLKPRKGYAFRRHLRTMHMQYRADELPRAKMDASVCAWVGHVQHGNTYGLRQAVLTPLAL